MAERAAHLVDHVFPDVPVRQWVLSRALAGGARAGRARGISSGRPRRPRMRRMTAASSMSAMSRRRPPHRGQASTSNPKAGCINSLTPQALKSGYDWAYREFYRWSSIARGSWVHGTLKHQAKHVFYAAGWKRFEGLWDAGIRMKQLPAMTPLLESVLAKVTAERRSSAPAAPILEPIEMAAARPAPRT